MAEVKKISSKEFRIQDNKIFFIEDKILCVEANGEQTDDIALASLEFQKSITKQVSGKLNFLIDLNNSGKHSTRARKIWMEMSLMENTGKIAVFGIHPVARLLANFIIGGQQYKNIRFFNSREEALAWLNAGD